MTRPQEVQGGWLRMLEPPVSRVSYSGGPLHGRTALEEDWVQGVHNFKTDTLYRRESPGSTRFTYRGTP